jgi:hypothetical protein
MDETIFPIREGRMKQAPDNDAPPQTTPGKMPLTTRE